MEKNLENKNNINFDTNVKSIEDLDIKQHAFIVICSKRASGKSVLLKNLVKDLLDKYEYDLILMFSETAHLQNDFSFIPKEQIFKTDDLEEKLEKLLKIQEKNLKKQKKINLLIILDDVKLHNKSKMLVNLSSLGRHYLITVCFSVQFCKNLCNSTIRNNVDYWIFSDLGEIALKSIYESIHIPLSYREFDKFVNEHNHSYQFIMYDSRTQNRNERLKLIKGKQFEKLQLV